VVRVAEWGQKEIGKCSKENTKRRSLSTTKKGGSPISSVLPHREKRLQSATQKPREGTLGMTGKRKKTGPMLGGSRQRKKKEKGCTTLSSSFQKKSEHSSSRGEDELAKKKKKRASCGATSDTMVKERDERRLSLLLWEKKGGGSGCRLCNRYKRHARGIAV